MVSGLNVVNYAFDWYISKLHGANLWRVAVYYTHSTMTATNTPTKTNNPPAAQVKTAPQAQAPVKRAATVSHVQPSHGTATSRVGSGRIVKVAESSSLEDDPGLTAKKSPITLAKLDTSATSDPVSASAEEPTAAAAEAPAPEQASHVVPKKESVATTVASPAPKHDNPPSLTNGEIGVIVVGSLVLTALLGVLWRVGTLKKEIRETNQAFENHYSKNQVDLQETVAAQVESMAADLKGLKSTQTILQNLISTTKAQNDELQTVRSAVKATQKSLESLQPTIKAQVADIKELRSATASANTSANRIQTSVNYLFKEVSAIQMQSNIGRAEVKAIRHDVQALVSATQATEADTQPDTSKVAANDGMPTRPLSQSPVAAPAPKNQSPLRTSIKERDAQTTEHVAYADVRELAQTGLSRTEIASQLNIELAVVDLVLAVANYKENAVAA